MDNRSIGKEYEDIASNYLKNNGYKIVTINFFSKSGEIDIIGYDSDVLCFIEVKYRKKDSLANAVSAVDSVKQKRIYDTAKYYLYINKIDEDKTSCRFDVITIDDKNIDLIKNAFP